jgi:uncharacterized protein
MEQAQAVATQKQPLWQRVLNFPLLVLLIAVALFIAAERATFLIGVHLLPPRSTLSGLAAVAVVEIILLVTVYKLGIARIGECPRDELRLANAGKELGLGVAVGFLLFCAIVGAAAAIDVYNIVGDGNLDGLAQSLIATAILPGIREELFFRGVLFRWIEEFAGSWAALFVTSALFGLAHVVNPNATWFSSFTIAVEAGVLLGGAYMLTRSLWMPIGLHAAWNFTQGFIFDVPVSGIDQQGLVTARLSGPELLSGGAFGLEASVIALVIATAAGVWLVMLSVKRGELVHPWWVRRRRQRGDERI